MRRIIGIDLGTTNSCVSVAAGNMPRVIENSEGTLIQQHHTLGQSYVCRNDGAEGELDVSRGTTSAASNVTY